MKRSDLKIKPRRVGRGGNPELAVYYHLNPNTKTTKKKKGKGKKEDLKKLQERLRQQGSRNVAFDTTRTDDREFVDIMRAINPTSKTKRPANLSRLRQLRSFGEDREAVPSAFSTDFTQPKEFAPIPEKFQGLTKPVDPEFRRKALTFRKALLKDLQDGDLSDEKYFEMQDKLDSINKYLGPEYENKVSKVGKFDNWKNTTPKESVVEAAKNVQPPEQKVKFPQDRLFRNKATKYAKDLELDLQKATDRNEIAEIKDKIEKIGKNMGLETENVIPSNYPNAKSSKLFSLPPDDNNELINFDSIPDKVKNPLARITRNRIKGGKPIFPPTDEVFFKDPPSDLSWDPQASFDSFSDLSWENPQLAKESKELVKYNPRSYIDQLYDNIDKPLSKPITRPETSMDWSNTSRNALEDVSRNALKNTSRNSLSNSTKYYTADSSFGSLDSSRASLPSLDSTPVPIYTSTPINSRPGTPSLDNLSSLDVFDEPSKRSLDSSFRSVDSSFSGDTPYNTVEEIKPPKFTAPKPQPKVFYSKPGTSSRIAELRPEEIAEIGAPTPTPATPSTPTNIVEDLSDAPRTLPKTSYTSTLKGVGSLAGNMLANVLINEGVKKYASLFDWDKDEGSQALRETLNLHKGKQIPTDSVFGSGMDISTY